MGGLERILDKTVNYVKQKGRSIASGLMLGSLAIGFGLSYFQPKIPSTEEVEVAISQGEINPMHKDYLPWALAVTACFGIYSAGVFYGISRFRKESKRILITDENAKKGILDWFVDHPYITSMTMPLYAGAQIVYAITSGMIQRPALDTAIIVSPWVAFNFGGAASIALGLHYLRAVQPPVSKNFGKMVSRLSKHKNLLENSNLDQIVEFYKEDSKYLRLQGGTVDMLDAMRQMDAGDLVQGLFSLESAVLKMHLLKRAGGRNSFLFPDRFISKFSSNIYSRWAEKRRHKFDDLSSLILEVFLKEEFTDSDELRSILSEFQRNNPEQSYNLHAVSAFLFSALDRPEIAGPHIRELTKYANPERVGDYEVYRLKIEYLNDFPLILKRHQDTKVLEDESYNLDYFLSHKSRENISASWPLGVIDSGDSVYLIETCARGSVAYDVLNERPNIKLVRAILESTAEVHNTMQVPIGKIDTEKYCQKIEPFYTDAIKQLFGLFGTRYIFDGDSHLDNRLVGKNQIAVIDLAPRGPIWPEHDVARSIGLLPVSMSMDEINSCIESYLACANRSYETNDFIRAVHIAVPMRALSYGAAMRDRPALTERVARFVQNGRKSIRFVAPNMQSHGQPIAQLDNGLVKLESSLS